MSVKKRRLDIMMQFIICALSKQICFLKEKLSVREGFKKKIWKIPDLVWPTNQTLYSRKI